MSSFMGKAEAGRPGPLSVAELNTQARALLERTFPDVWVEGEVGRISTPPSGHLYFSLKDSKASVDTVVWSSSAARIGFPLQEGDRVLVRGNLTVFVGGGRYQLVCRTVTPAGEGELRAAFLALKERLEGEGLMDPARKRPLPFLPKGVGLVTSPSGAAVHDMLRAIRDRFPAMRCVLVPSAVQGDGAVSSLVDGLRRAAAVAGIDVVVVGRGGGSLEDLAAFNDERLARAIAATPIPVVSAVGHEIDVTIADLVADARALTPTAAGELVVPEASLLRSRLADLFRRRGLNLFPGLMEEHRQSLDVLGSQLAGRLRRRVHHERERLDARKRQLLLASPRGWVRERRLAVTALARRLDAAGLARVGRARASLAPQASALDALNPLAVLGRGFSVTRRIGDDGKHVVHGAEGVSAGDRIETTFAAGDAILSEVEERIPRDLPEA